MTTTAEHMLSGLGCGWGEGGVGGNAWDGGEVEGVWGWRLIAVLTLSWRDQTDPGTA